jgi:predicted nucleic acid-binding protein
MDLLDTVAISALTVVTRNLRDFVPLGVATVNPWEETA